MYGADHRAHPCVSPGAPVIMALQKNTASERWTVPVKFTGTVQRSEAAQSGHHYVFVRPPRTAYRPCSGCYPVSGAVTFISAGHLNPSRLSRSLELPIGPNEE